jgi:hypothetical protein
MYDVIITDICDFTVFKLQLSGGYIKNYIRFPFPKPPDFGTRQKFLHPPLHDGVCIFDRLCNSSIHHEFDRYVRAGVLAAVLSDGRVYIPTCTRLYSTFIENTSGSETRSARLDGVPALDIVANMRDDSTPRHPSSSQGGATRNLYI